MSTKVAEIRQDHRGDRRQCPICNPRDSKSFIPADQLWQWSLRNSGMSPFKASSSNGQDATFSRS